MLGKSSFIFCLTSDFCFLCSELETLAGLCFRALDGTTYAARQTHQTNRISKHQFLANGDIRHFLLNFPLDLKLNLVVALNRLSVAKLLGTLVAHTQDLSNKKQVSGHYPQFFSDPDYSLNPDSNPGFLENTDTDPDPGI